jgi:hypothetical protein
MRSPVTLWDTRIERTAPVAPQLAKLDKQSLLDELRKGWKRGPQSMPFDADQSWRHLTHFAKAYFSHFKTDKETLSPGDRIARLRKFADALKDARAIADEALQDDNAVGGDLFRAWVNGTDEPLATLMLINDDKSSGLTRIADEIKKAVLSLATLESAARKAADYVPKRPPGRPQGAPLLPRDGIVGLAYVFKTSTGSKPGAGPGPFSRFVCAFFKTAGQDDLVSASVIDAIKDARARSLAGEWGRPSPFDGEP